MNKLQAGRADYVLLVYFLILLVFGLLMLTSASSAVAHQKFADSYFYIKRQLLFGVLPGLILFFLLAKIDYHLLKRMSWLFFVASIALLIFVFIPGLGANLGTSSL